MSLPYPPPFQDLKTLAAHVCAGERTIEEWVRRGEFPQPRKVGGKNLWSWKEVERWLTREETAATAASNMESLRERTRRVAEAGR